MCRFAFELLEYVFKLHETRLLVHNQTDERSWDEELTNDILAINTVFICRLQGKRTAENRRRRRDHGRTDTGDDQQARAVLQPPSTGDLEEMDRVL